MDKDIKTIIFDMDGVLFDSESLDKKVWIDLAGEYGIKDIMSAFKEAIGTPDYNIISVLDRYIEKSRQDGCTGSRSLEGLTGERFRKETLVFFDKYVEEQGMPLKYYAAECLYSLKKKGYKLGLASSTPVERVVPQLTDTGLIGYFDDVVGGGMYKKGKPDPEVFLLSCERLGGVPDETIVIEDSYNGIRAAYAAGMRPIMVPDLIMPDDEMKSKAWKIFENLKEVDDFLLNINDTKQEECMKEWKGYRRGVNIGGWLSQCKHTYEHYDSFVCEDDFKNISSWGLDHVRIPVDYNLIEDENGNYIEKGFGYIAKAIEWCKNSGLNMILDIHKTYGFSFDKDEQETGFFDNESSQERFIRMWENLAERFGNIGESVAFELLNEVTDREYIITWNAIVKRCIERIRKIAPRVKILVGSYWNNHVAAVQDLDPPYDENIIYNFHCYEPLIFTHQGAGWIDVMPRDFRMGFKKTYKEYKDLCRPISEFWDRDFFVPTKVDDMIDSTYFEKMFESALVTAKKYDVALYCGEYGVIDLATPEDTLKWYQTINPIFEKYGIGRAAWSYKSMNFGLCEDRLAGIRSELLKVM